jgi:acyl carrier protein
MDTTTTQTPVIRDFILKTVVEDLNNPLDLDAITDASPVGAGGLELDSLSLIELMLRLEQRFGAQIPDDDIEPLGAMSLGELAADVARRGTRP